MKRFNICIVRPYGYLWSSSFLDLADLLALSLRDNGYVVEIKENSICHRSRNVVIGCHLLDESFIPAFPEDTIVFNTEKLLCGNWVWDERITPFAKSFETWDYSRKNVEIVYRLTGKIPKHFIIGYHSKPHRILKNPKGISMCCFMAPRTQDDPKFLRPLNNLACA